MKYLILLTTLIFAGELEVDGDLKVTGTVDASGNPITNVGAALSMTDAINGNVLQSALRDDGVYEYKFISAKFKWSLTTTNPYTFSIEYKEVESSDWNDGFENYLNQLILDGWRVSARLGQTQWDSDLIAIYELRRLVSDD